MDPARKRTAAYRESNKPRKPGALVGISSGRAMAMIERVRKSMTPAEFTRHCRVFADAAFNRVLELVDGKPQPGGDVYPAVQLRAAEYVIDRGYGKPTERVEVDEYRDLPDDELARRARELAGRISALVSGGGQAGSRADGGDGPDNDTDGLELPDARGMDA